MSGLDPATTALVARYRAGVGRVTAALAGITPAELDREPDEGWTTRMVVHHLADSETQSYARLRRLLAEDEGTLIQGYDEARWATCAPLGYRTEPIEPSLAVFTAVRAANAALLDRLNATDLARHGVHTESGRYTVADWLAIYAAHAEDHAAQIEHARRGERS